MPGPEPADTLMHHLPPVGWADVVTKHDLDVTRELLGMQIQALGSELRAEFHDGMRRQMLQMVTAFGALQTLFIAALKFI